MCVFFLKKQYLCNVSSSIFCKVVQLWINEMSIALLFCQVRWKRCLQSTYFKNRVCYQRWGIYHIRKRGMKDLFNMYILVFSHKSALWILSSRHRCHSRHTRTSFVDSSLFVVYLVIMVFIKLTSSNLCIRKLFAVLVVLFSLEQNQFAENACAD